MRLRDVVVVHERVGATRSRIAKRAALADLLRACSPEELDVVVAWLCGELRQGRIGLGPASLRAVRGVTPAAEARLAVLEVDAAFSALGARGGPGSKAAREDDLRALFASATDPEQRFLAGLVVGELRQGALEGLLVEALADASGRPADEVRRAAMLGGELRAVAAAALTGGDLGAFRLEVGRPLQPMLAQSAGSPEEALGKLGRAALEWKLDGARIQVHREGDLVRVFSRRLNEVTHAVPEVREAVLALPLERAVLDGEAIALAPDGRPRPFQETMRRFGRRAGVDGLRAELPLSPFFFDLLHADGEDWIDRPFEERSARLAQLVPARWRVPSAVTDDVEEAEAFYAQALERGHEGLVVKALDAPYEAGRRGAPWLKVKPAHTLDLVVLAAEHGSGRRSGWLSNLHLGARDPASGGFVMVGKTFKGMSDELLAWQTEALERRATRREGHVVHVVPELVVEVALDGVQASPHYEGGAALRFARLRGYRPDKRPEEADTIETVRALGGLA